MPAAQDFAPRATGEVLYKRGLYVAVKEEWERWLSLAEGTDDPNEIVRPLNALTVLSMARKDPEQALIYSDRAVTLVRERLEPMQELNVWHNRIAVFSKAGRLDDAVAMVAEAEPLLSAIQSPARVARFWQEVSYLHYRRLDWVLLRRLAETVQKLAESTGQTLVEARATLNLGIAHLEMGAYNLARRDLEKAERMFAQLGAHEVAYTRTELGRLHFAQGEMPAALDLGRQALSELFMNVAILDKEEVARLSSLFGTIFAGAGQRNMGLKYLNRAAAYYSQLGLLPDWRRATDAVAKLLTAGSRPLDPGLKDAAFRLDFLTTVLDLTDDIESVDPYLRGHSERVASLALILGRQVGLSEELLYELNHAARLHDLGKVAVDAEILQKPGRLTEAEFERVKMHPVIGEEMLRPYSLTETQLKAIRHHHERWGGRGYPDGLVGEEIPPLARIIAIADVYDAMTSDRVYRRALTHSEAMAEMHRMSGPQLDPLLVQEFFKLHKV